MNHDEQAHLRYGRELELHITIVIMAAKREREEERGKASQDRRKSTSAT